MKLNRETLGWLMLAEKSMAKIWNNELDDQEGSRYLKVEQTGKNKLLNSNRKNK